MHLHPAHAHPLPGWKNFQLVFPPDAAGNQRASYDRPKTFHGEDAIDGQARNRLGIFRRNLGGGLHEFPLQIPSMPAPVSETDSNDGVGLI